MVTGLFSWQTCLLYVGKMLFVWVCCFPRYKKHALHIVVVVVVWEPWSTISNESQPWLLHCK